MAGAAPKGLSGMPTALLPSRVVIGIVQMPEAIRNFAFGGPNFRTLYLTHGVRS